MSTIQRKLALIAGCALMAIAVAAPAASAETVTEYVNPFSGDPCQIWGESGNCQNDATDGYLELITTQGGLITRCEDGSANVVVDAQGNLSMFDTKYSPSGDCAWNYYITSCGADFSGQISGSLASGYEIKMNICVKGNGTSPAWVKVPFDVDVNEVGVLTGLTQQKDAFSYSGPPVGISDLHFNLEGNAQAIEVEVE